MPRFTNSSLEKLRDAVDMVDLVNGYTDLRRAGTQFSGVCPFHDERTPSFSVNPSEKLFYCFGCQAGGDAITFVQRTESLEFAESVEWLADRYGVELEYEELDPREAERQKRRERLYELLERAAKFYERYLWDSPEAARARDYLLGRGFGEEVLKKFRVGYSPSAWDKLFVPALQQGFTEEELLAAGLVQRSSKNPQQIFDRFRGRVMFPLSDPRGRVRGFGARAMKDGDRPKYLNSADGLVYSKGRQLFGANHARSIAAKRGRVVVVEGYADVLALHQAGIEESVAVMGTAMTDDQLVELARLAPRIFIALDADRAGRQAMIRAARVADRHGIGLSVVELPLGEDPADLVQKDGGKGAFEALLDDSVTVLEFEVNSVLSAAKLDSARGKDAALAELMPIFAAAPEGAVKDEQLRKVADRLETSEASLSRLREARSKQAESRSSDPHGEKAQIPAVSAERELAERLFMAMCLAEPGSGREFLEKLTDEQLSTPLMSDLRDHLLKCFENPLAGASGLKAELRDAVTEVAMLSERENASAMAIQLGFLQLKKAGLDRSLAGAPAAEKAEIERKRQEVIKQLGDLTAEYA